MNALDDKKAENILLLDIHELASFADFFVICSATSDRMLDALATAAVETVKQQYGINARIEGESREGWVVVDTGDVIVHLFSPDQREYYRLEQLWERGKVLMRMQ